MKGVDAQVHVRAAVTPGRRSRGDRAPGLETDVSIESIMDGALASLARAIG